MVARSLTPQGGLAASPSILERLADDLRQVGLVGEVIPAAQLVYLATVSRLLDRPVNVVVKGPSSGGKSWTVKQALAFHPRAAYHALTAMSERALIYDTTPISHRMLVVYEADGIAGELASALLRTLLSEGEIHYTTVESGKDGLKPKTIRREGPTGLITTTTALNLHPENETRLFSVTVPDTPAQTRDVLRAWGASMAGGSADPVDYAPWHALSEWLADDLRGVVIPYAPALAELTSARAVRLRRDFIAMATLVQAHALLHRATRSVDTQGRIVAVIDDYAAVRSLVEPLIAAGVAASVKREVRHTVEAVARLGRTRSGTLLGDPSPITQTELVAELELDKSSVNRRVKDALELGYLRDLEPNRGRPSQLVLGEPMPHDVPVLPTPEALAASLVGCGGSENVQPPKETA